MHLLPQISLQEFFRIVREREEYNTREFFNQCKRGIIIFGWGGRYATSTLVFREHGNVDTSQWKINKLQWTRLRTVDSIYSRNSASKNLFANSDTVVMPHCSRVDTILLLFANKRELEFVTIDHRFSMIDDIIDEISLTIILIFFLIQSYY